MIDLNPIKDIYLFAGVTDFRKGILGLSGEVIFAFPNQVDRKDNLYIFCNTKKNQIKILHYDETGIWLYHKRLNKGKFVYPNASGEHKITKENLTIMLEGLNFIQKIEGYIDQNYALF